MINTNRIVPVKQTDLISLYGVIFGIANVSITSVIANGIGEFELSSGSGNFLASEPVKTFNISSDVSSATIYFVADYNYEGFKINNSDANIVDNGVVVEKDGSTLYKAVLATNQITITKIGF